MYNGSHRIAALAAGGALLIGACTPVTTSETHGPGPFAGAGGAEAASQMHSGAYATTGEKYATGAPTQTVASATTFIIAKHQATQRQREVAIARARAAQQKIE